MKIRVKLKNLKEQIRKEVKLYKRMLENAERLKDAEKNIEDIDKVVAEMNKKKVKPKRNK